MKTLLIERIMLLWVWALIPAAGQNITSDTLHPPPDSDTINRPAEEPDIFDKDHSLRFADYLFRTGKYEYATEEYQRVIFMQPGFVYPKLQVVRSQKARKDFQKALNYFALYFPVFDTLSPSVQKEGIRLYILVEDYPEANFWLRKTSWPKPEKATWTLGIKALEMKWDEALQYYKTYEDSIRNPVFHQFGLTVQRRLEQPHKSPWIAGTLSALVPGLGKVYTKDYGDAAMSLLFVGLNAWQAYRGFRKEGIKSVHGWVFAGIGATFYLGNIWGSAKAAKRFNRKFDKEATDEIKAVFEYHL